LFDNIGYISGCGQAFLCIKEDFLEIQYLNRRLKHIFPRILLQTLLHRRPRKEWIKKVVLPMQPLLPRNPAHGWKCPDSTTWIFCPRMAVSELHYLETWNSCLRIAISSIYFLKL